MPLIKIGQSTYNDTTSPIFLLQGTATRDGERKSVGGKDLGKVSVAAGDRKDGSGTLFVTLNGWRERAAYVAGLRKLDSVLAVGRIHTSTGRNGAEYVDMDADFVIVSGETGAAEPPAFRAASDPVAVSADGFEEIDENADGELPF